MPFRIKLLSDTDRQSVMFSPPLVKVSIQRWKAHSRDVPNGNFWSLLAPTALGRKVVFLESLYCHL